MTKASLERQVEYTIDVLRKMTQGQGSVTVHVFDAGGGGGFQSARVSIDLMRDGLFGEAEVTSTVALKMLLMRLCESPNSEWYDKILRRRRREDDAAQQP